MVSATRSITWRSDVSRSSVPRVPRKYFWETMLVEFCDQVAGNSTPSWRKEPTAAVRVSQSTVSNGCTPGWVKRRWMRIASPETTPSVVRGDCVGGVMLLLQDTGVCRSNGGVGCAHGAAEIAHVAGLFALPGLGPEITRPVGVPPGAGCLRE